MKVMLLDTFIQKLNRQVALISKYKPQAARKFKNELLEAEKKLPNHPQKFKEPFRPLSRYPKRDFTIKKSVTGK